MKIGNGDLVKDRITGFTGIVMCVAHYQYNQDRVGVRSRELVNGNPGELQWFDIYMMELVEACVVLDALCDTENIIGYSTVVKDSVSGFTGKVTGFDEWINGCVRYRVESESLKDGSPILPEAFPAEQLLIIRKPDEDKPPVRTGGPMKNPSQAAGSRW